MLFLGTSQAVLSGYAHDVESVDSFDRYLDHDSTLLSFLPYVEHESGHLVVLVSHDLNLLVAFGRLGFWQ